MTESTRAPARRILAAAAIAASMGGIAPAYGQSIGYSVAVSAVRGTYPNLRLTGSYVFNSVDVTSGPVRVWASVPFARQWSSFDSIDPVTGVLTPVRRTTTGFGDPLARLDLRLHRSRDHSLHVGVAAAVKPSLVDPADGLGTGATDVAFGGSVFKTLARTSVYADVMFWKYGDPEGVDFQDTVAYNIGVGHAVGKTGWSVMGSLSGFSRWTPGTAAPMQVNVAAIGYTGRRQSLAFNAAFALNDSASDFSIGTSWRVSLR